jgi:hypothetical protein
LTALYPDISDELSAIREIDEVLKNKWKTIRVNVPDAPRQIWKAIIWEALNRQSKDVTSAAVIWLTASSLINYLTIDPNERTLLMEFLISLRDKVEQKVTGEWEKSDHTVSDSEFFNYKPEEIIVYTAKTEKFEKDLLKACGPTDPAGTAIAGANSVWPSSQAPWAAEFAKIVTKAVGERIDKSAIDLKDSITAELNRLAEELKQGLVHINENVMGGVQAERLRDDLLWWRQTLYSRTFKASYRELEPAEASFFMAFDLYKLLPAIHPISVEYLLRESFRTAHNEQTQIKVKLSDLINKIVSSSNTGLIGKESGNYYKNFGDPLPLFASVTKGLGTESAAGDLISSLGLKEDIEISFEDLSVWFFRDLQAQRLAVQK